MPLFSMQYAPGKFRAVSPSASKYLFKNSSESVMYKICKNFKPPDKNLKYLIIDSRGKILKNSYNLKILLNDINWKKL